MAKPEPPRELYNRETGGRLDLYVFEEPEAVAAARWTAARRAYLQQLIAAPSTSAFARQLYEKELSTLAK